MSSKPVQLKGNSKVNDNNNHNINMLCTEGSENSCKELPQEGVVQWPLCL